MNLVARIINADRTARELRDKEEAYKRMATRLGEALTQLAGHDGCADRERALQAALAGERERVADLAAQLELVLNEGAEMTAALDAMTKGLCLTCAEHEGSEA